MRENGNGRATTVRDLMTAHVVTVVPEMTVRELVQTFLEEHVRGAPVVGPTGKVVGIVSETDVLRLVLAAPGPSRAPVRTTGNGAGAPRDLDELTVRDIMEPVGHVVAPDDPASRVAKTFSCGSVQRVVVMDNDVLLGIVTPADLIRTLDAAI